MKHIIILSICLVLFSNNLILPVYSTERTKVALALGGGGTRGAAHIGVLKVLKEEGIQIDAIAGTSMGAVVGGLYCAGMELDDIESIFYHRKLIRAFYSTPLPIRIMLFPFVLVARVFGYRPYDGLYIGNKFGKYINSLVSEERSNIENCQPKFWAVATNLLDGEPIAIKEGNLGKAIQASSAIPELRRPVKIKHSLLVDGGVGENLPTKEALKMNCDYVIAVNVDPKISTMPIETFESIGSVANRVVDIMLARTDKEQIDLANLVIQPDTSGIKLLSLKQVDVRQAILAGEDATRKAIPEIRRQLRQQTLH